jgi:hypothetical protein
MFLSFEMHHKTLLTGGIDVAYAGTCHRVELNYLYDGDFMIKGATKTKVILL